MPKLSEKFSFDFESNDFDRADPSLNSSTNENFSSLEFNGIENYLSTKEIRILRAVMLAQEEQQRIKSLSTEVKHIKGAEQPIAPQEKAKAIQQLLFSAKNSPISKIGGLIQQYQGIEQMMSLVGSANNNNSPLNLLNHFNAGPETMSMLSNLLGHTKGQADRNDSEPPFSLKSLEQLLKTQDTDSLQNLFAKAKSLLSGLG